MTRHTTHTTHTTTTFPELFTDRMPLFRLPAAAAIAGVSYRQADHWITQGHVEIAREAEGSGSQRLISAAQFVRLCQIQQLRTLGISLGVATDPPPAISDLVDDVEILTRLRELAELRPAAWLLDGQVHEPAREGTARLRPHDRPRSPGAPGRV